MNGISTFRITSPRVSGVHAHIMEKCMRRSPGCTVGIDAVLMNPRTNKLVAVYWTVNTFETYPDIHELHMMLDDHNNLNEYCPLQPTKWNQYKWRLSPDGRVTYSL